jgi:hypothetical protein
MAELSPLGDPVGTISGVSGIAPPRMPQITETANIREAIEVFYYGNNISGPVLTAGQEADIPSASIAGRLRDLSNNKLDKASPTTTGKLTTAASTTGLAGFNVPHGVAPTSPVSGDIWTTSTGLWARLGSTSTQFASVDAINFNKLISIDNSTTAHTLQIGYGATVSGSQKTVNVGGGGAAGSTTAITIGGTVGTTVTLNGTVSAPTSLTSPSLIASTSLTIGSGVTLTSGTGAPASSPGNGSVYLRSDGAYDTTLYARASGAWKPLRSSRLYTGVGTPGALGEVPGDTYVDRRTGDIWTAS